MALATHRSLLEREQARLERLRDRLVVDPDDDAIRLSPPADAGSELAEREGRLSLRIEVDGELVDVAAALARLDADRYGTCEACGTTIDADRLEAVPATRWCRDHEVEAERRAVRREVEADHRQSEQVAVDTLADLALADPSDDAPRRLVSAEEAAVHRIQRRS